MEARQGRARGRAGPSKVRLYLSLSLSAPRWAKLQPPLPPPCLTLVVISLARYFCVALTRTPLLLRLPIHRVTLVVFFLRLPACLPLPACRSVGSRFPSRNPPCSDSRALSLLSPLPLTSRGYVSLARGINTPVGRLRAAKRPKPRSRKRRRLYRVTPRAAFVAPCAASESIDFEICSNRSAHPDFP